MHRPAYGCRRACRLVRQGARQTFPQYSTFKSGAVGKNETTEGERTRKERVTTRATGLLRTRISYVTEWNIARSESLPAGADREPLARASVSLAPAAGFAYSVT